MITDHIADFLFLCLMVVKLRTTYSDDSGAVVTDWWEIFKKELRGWLLLDLISLIPIPNNFTKYWEFSLMRVVHLLFEDYPFGPLEITFYKFLQRYINHPEGKFVRARKILVYLHVLVCGWVEIGSAQLPSTGWIFNLDK